MGIEARVFSRAGLAGNPSDAYFGRAVAVPIFDFSARVRCEPSTGVTVVPPGGPAVSWRDVAHLEAELKGQRVTGAASVLAAAVVIFESALLGREHVRPGFALRAETDIPVRVGLAGSSALVIASLRALSSLYGIELSRERLPTLALRVETELLGIHGGLMDRVVQTYEVPVYMDLARELLERDGHGRYERLDAAALPPLFLAWDPDAAAGSETVHNELRLRFERGDAGVLEAMQDLARLADEARQLLLNGRGDALGPLMDANFDLRARIVPVGPRNRRLVDTARRLGAFAKQAGSGGAVIGTWDGDPERLSQLRSAYEAIGAGFAVPRVRGAPADDDAWPATEPGLP